MRVWGADSGQPVDLLPILEYKGKISQRVLCSPLGVAYLGLGDAVLLPKVVHDPEDAQWPGESQKVSQDAKSATQDQASPKGVAERLPDGPGPLRALRVLLLPRENPRPGQSGQGPVHRQAQPPRKSLAPAAWGNPVATLVANR